MRVFLAAGILICALSLASACKKDEPAGDATTPATEEPAGDATATGGEEQPEPGEDEGDAGEAGEGAEESDAEEAAEEELPEPRGDLDEATCRRVCDHATDLTMKSLPPDASAEMKAEIEQALRTNCPEDCLRKGTDAMAECITKARTALDLASCPK